MTRVTIYTSNHEAIQIEHYDHIEDGLMFIESLHNTESFKNRLFYVTLRCGKFVWRKI